jgi:hypothetical protein
MLSYPRPDERGFYLGMILRHVDKQTALTDSRYMVCYAKLRQLDRRRSQLLNQLRQSFRWGDCTFDLLDLRRIR